MPYSYTLTSIIPASSQEVYEAWLDSVAHSQMTGGEATMSDEVNAEVSAWDGYITGRNLDLAPGQRIVQSWRTSKFTDEHEDSIVTVTLEDVGDGTLLTLAHSNVPDEQRSYEEGGWETHYFEPMKVYFASLGEANEARSKRAKKQGAKNRRKAKAPSKRLSKASRRKTKPKRTAAANGKDKAKRKKPAAKRAARKLMAKRKPAKRKRTRP